MTEVDKILAAICFSEYCIDTLAYAIRLADQLHAEVIVANVINIRDVRAVATIETMGYAVSADDYVKGVKEERKGQLERMLGNAGYLREKLKSVFKVGHVFEELIKVVKDEGIDLVVMGHKGRSNHPHLLVGSVAEKMFRHSPVSVLYHKKKSA